MRRGVMEDFAMKKIILGMAAVSTLAIAAPAMAQRGYVNSNIDVRIGELQSQLQAGVQHGSISRQEAIPLRQQLRALTRLERQYSRDGLSRSERQDLQQRVQTLRQQIRIAERSGNGRWADNDGRRCPPGLERRNNGCTPPGQVGRDGRWEDRRDDRWDDRRDRDGRWGDRDDDRYDDRDRDRDGRWERDSDDDRYDDRYDDRNNRGGILGNILGGGALRVGQRIPSNLGAVPYHLRNQYRDGNGVFYRADSRRVYEVDARTHTVVRIYQM